MTDSPHTLHARLSWVRTYHETRHAGLTCLRCGISRPTLRKWLRRYEAEGLPGLQSRDHTPKHLAPTKLTPELVERLLLLRRTRNLGSKRLQAELLREDGTRLSTSTLHKALSRAAVPPLRRPKRERRFKRYNRPHAGDRVQIDSMKVAKGLYQFTAIDDCTRLRVLGLYPNRKAVSAAHFFETRLVPEMPFPIERIQSDRGSEFIGEEFVQTLRRHRVKLRPNKARSPHLNGKVERSQQTDLVEFYALEIDGKGKARVPREQDQLEQRLKAWQHFYNEVRPHGGIGGKTPQRRWEEVEPLTPTREVLDGRYDGSKEPRWIKRGKRVLVLTTPPPPSK